MQLFAFNSRAFRIEAHLRHVDRKPVYGYKMVIIAYAHKPPLNAHADISSRAGGLNYGLHLPLLSHILCMGEVKALARLH